MKNHIQRRKKKVSFTKDEAAGNVIFVVMHPKEAAGDRHCRCYI